jgi:hypothetical protein
VPEEDFAAWQEMRLPTLHIRDLPQGCAAIEWRQPNPRSAGVVRRFHHNLAAVRRNIEIEDRKTGRQRLGAARFQVGHHHLSKISVIRELVGLLPYHAV